MKINQIITKAETETVKNKYKGAFGFNYYFNMVTLLFSVGIAGYSGYNAVKYFAAKDSITALMFVLYFLIACWFIPILLYNCRIKRTFKYINNLQLMMYGKDYCSISADEEGILFDDTVSLKWKDFEVVFLCGEYVVLGSYKKFSAILKVTEEEKNQICHIMAGNKKAVVALDKSKDAQKYNQKAVNSFKKKKFIIIIVLVIMMVIILLKSMVPVIPVVNDSTSSAKQDFNPELAFNGQMANALDSEGVTGYNFDAEYMFDMYSEYVKYRFNTAVRESDNAPEDRELWFFDGETAKFGFETSNFNKSDKRQISYYNGENSVIIAENKGQPYAENQAYQLESWDKIFAQLIMKDYTLSKYPKLETFGGSGSDYFYAKFRDKTGKGISYRFGENYILCEEYRGKRVVNSFLVVFTYKYEYKLDNTETLFDKVLAETEKEHSEQNIDFNLLVEEIEKYCDYKVRE